MRRCGLPRWLPVLAAAGLLVPGCKDDGELVDDDVDTTTGADTGDDVDPGGTGTGEDESTGGEDEVVFELESVFGVPNLDDDDENGTADWYELPFDGDNDLSALHVPGVPEGYTVEMTLAGDLEHIRVWRGGSDFIGHGGDPIVDTFSFDPGPEGTVLDVEFGEYNARGVLHATLFDREGAEVESIAIDLHASPLILNHHLQPTERVWVVETGNWGGNASMIADIEAVVGSRLTKIPGGTVGHDVWVQDEIELATSAAADGTRLDTVIDSIRERGLAPYPKNVMPRPDKAVRMWGHPASATTFDAFGNLEASPPVTVNGVEYPFGRVYYGREGVWGLDDVLADFLAAQEVQAPFELNTAWLCVGHIDEVSSFVPDPSSPKGFKLLFSDIPSAYEILDGLDPTISLPRYQSGHGFATVGDIVDNAGLRAYNMDRQALYLDPMLDVFKAELDLDDSDIILIPTLKEQLGGCGSAALIPGTINLLVVNVDDTTHLFVADPFLRSQGSDQSSDPIAQDFVARMPDGIEVHFVDNWNVYHLGNGEVHCATNDRRTPMAMWYEDAMHLLAKEND
jgi:hypothetical protein